MDILFSYHFLAVEGGQVALQSRPQFPLEITLIPTSPGGRKTAGVDVCEALSTLPDTC